MNGDTKGRNHFNAGLALRTAGLPLLVVVGSILLRYALVSEKSARSENGESEVIIFLLRILVLSIFFYNCYLVFSFFWIELLQCTKTRERTGNEFMYPEYILYRIDYHFSRNRKMQGMAIGVVAMLIILIGGILWSLGTGDPIIESMWTAWTFIADPGTHAESTGILKRVISLGLTLGGMCIFAVVIGTISDGISTSVDNLRKGKSRVIESNHTLILGQGDKLIPTIRQIALANASCGGGIIVVLTTLPKEELENTLRDAALDMMGTEVIVRTGVPHMQSDLKKVSAAGARSIIVLADRVMTSADNADVNTVRTVLSLRGMDAPKEGHIVCEVCDVDDEELVKLVGQDSVETIVSHDIIGRLMIQCALEPGLAQVLETLLGFEDNEFYINDCSGWSELVGLRFDQLMFRFEDAVVVGFLKGKTGSVILNPPQDETLDEGDSLVVIAEDDDTYAPMAKEHTLSKSHLERIYKTERQQVHKREKMLFVGWRRDMDDMILQLDHYVAEGSQLTLYSQHTLAERFERLQDGGMDVELCPVPPPSTRATAMLTNHPTSNSNSSTAGSRPQSLSLGNSMSSSDSGPSAVGTNDLDSKRSMVRRKSEMGTLSTPSSGSDKTKTLQITPVAAPPSNNVSSSRFATARLGNLSLSSPLSPAGKLSSPFDFAEGEMQLKLKNLRNLEVFHIVGNQTSRRDLLSVPLHSYDSILILADEDLEASQSSMDMVNADSRSLTTLLLIRAMQEEKRHHASQSIVNATGDHSIRREVSMKTTVISEILDPRTKSLLHTSNISDYVTSNELVSMAIAMVAEQRNVNNVLKQLLSTSGNQILLRPVTEYVQEGSFASFWDIAWIAKSRNDLLIGYKIQDRVFLNPHEKAARIAWTSSDELIVLRELRKKN